MQAQKAMILIIKKQLKYEFYDTLLSMVIGWAINSAMIILAASTFFKQNIAVDELDQAQQLLVPLVGNNAGVIFAPPVGSSPWTARAQASRSSTPA